MVEENYKKDKKLIDVLNKEIYPLFKVEFEDTHYLRDVDSGIWINSDDYELVRKSHRAQAFVKNKYGDEWIILYDDLSHDMVQAYIELRKIKQMYDYWRHVFVDEPPVMFVYQNNVFKNPHVMMSQLCISGEPIEPSKYFTDEGSVKVSFFKSYVKPVAENTILVHNEQVYFNGELLYSRSELEKLGIPTYSTSKIIDYVKAFIPEATSYESDMESGAIR